MSKIEWTDETIRRFLSNIDGMTIPNNNKCWNWKAGLFTSGYGQFRIGEKKYRAHRIMYEYQFGEIPKDKIICHRCDNPKCCNPLHLFSGTHKDNSTDRDIKGRGLLGRKIPKPKTRGSKNHASKLTERDVRNILMARKISDATYKDLAEIYSVSKSCIAQIIRGEKWLHIPRISGVNYETNKILPGPPGKIKQCR